MKLLIRNLSRTMNEQQLKKLFMPFGRVTSATLVTDAGTKKSKGFGFVEMEADIDGYKAITALDNSMAQNKKIRVKSAEPEPTIESDESSESKK